MPTHPVSALTNGVAFVWANLKGGKMQVRANVGMMQISNSRFCTVEQIESFNMNNTNLEALLQNKM